MNGDGAVDVVASSRDDKELLWYENDGSGDFTARTIATGIRKISVLNTGDLNGDGDPDVLVASGSNDGEIAWYENDGTWTKHTLLSQDVRDPRAVQVADLDRDGDLDALSIHSANGEDQLVWYENTGGGSFASQKVINRRMTTNNIQVADLDGDSEMDIVSGTNELFEEGEQVVWLENQGDESFSDLKQIAPLRDVGDVEVADIDADGVMDVVASNKQSTAASDSGRVEWYEHDGTPGDGGWTTHLVTDTLGNVEFLDVTNLDDDDGREIVASGQSLQQGYSTGAGGIVAFDSDGRPAAGEWGFHSVVQGEGAGEIATADVNGDQDPDVLNLTGSYISWIENDGMGGFRPSQPVTGVQASLVGGRPLTADLDGDGDPDLVEQGPALVWHENDGTGSFSTTFLSFKALSDVDIADVNGDGDLDLIGALGRAEVQDQDGDGDLEFVPTKQAVWFENDGMGGFSRAKTLIVSKHPIQVIGAANLDGDAPDEVIGASRLAYADFNGDDTIEEVEGEFVGKTTTRHDYDGGGALTNTRIDEYWGDTSQGGVIAGSRRAFLKDVRATDIDGDGDVDPLLFFESPDGASWFENAGGTLYAGARIAEDVGTDLDVADLDGDGMPGVFFAQPNTALERYVSWYEADSGGDFSLQEDISLPKGTFDGDVGPVRGAGLADMDGDGNIDLVTRENGITWWRNDGTQNFTPRPYSSRNQGPTAIADVDGDGNPDVLGARPGPNGETLIWLENRGLEIPSPPTSLSAQTVAPQRVPRGVEEIELDWSAPGADDIQQYVIHRETHLPLDSTRGPYFYDYAATDTISAGQTVYRDTDPLLQADTTYRYRITALDGYGNESSFSGEVRATLRPPLAAHTVRPSSGAPGTTLRIRGSSFSSDPSAHTVTVGGVEAPVDSAKETVIYARVPDASTLPDTTKGAVDVTLQTESTTLDVPGSFTVLRGGSETFTPSGIDIPPIENEYGAAHAWADYDNDGDQDLIVVGNDPEGSTTTLYRNDEGSLTPVDAGLPDVSGEAEWGDYDGDGRLDLMLSGSVDTGTKLFVYRNQGSGSFSKVVESVGTSEEDGTGIEHSAVGSWTDYDGDGDLDLYAGQMYRNEEEGIFRFGTPARLKGRSLKLIAETLFQVGFQLDRETWGDYNGDGHVDLLTGADGASVFKNDGEGSFTKVATDLGGSVSRAVAWGDYDKDGDLDVAVAGRTQNGPTTKILQNKGDGTFEAIGAGITGVMDFPSLDWGDFDGDGDLDLAVAGQANDRTTRTNHVTKIYRNDTGSGSSTGPGAFTAIDAGLKGVETASVDFGDFDGDGDLDLMVSGNQADPYEPISRLYRNEAPVAAEANVVTGGGTYSFGATGVVLNVSGVSSFGEVTVQQFDSKTQDTTGVVGPLASSDRFVISAGGAAFEGAEVNVALSALGPLSAPDEVVLYKRPHTGRGVFRALPTRLDKSGTPGDLSDDTLRAAVDSLSEFVLGPDPHPAPPTEVAAQPRTDSVALFWTAPDSPRRAEYRIYRDTAAIDSTGGSEALTPIDTTSAETTSFVDGEVGRDTTYHYRITAVDTTRAGAYEGAFSREVQATPGPAPVALADGRTGGTYAPPPATPGTEYNPVGRLRLSAPRAGAALEGLTVETEVGGAEGIEAAELWRSSNNTFNSGADQLIAVDSSAAPASFSGLGAPIPTDTTYVFVVLDLSEQASGEYEAVIRDEGMLTIEGGNLARVNGSDRTRFSDAYLSSGAAPLPVELTHFEARAKGDAMRLRWATASETGNAGFRVQRRVGTARPSGGRTGERERRPAGDREGVRWTTVGSVDGSGTTSEPQRYEFTDAEIPYAADSLAYRLKQVDVDGTVSYSRPVRVVRRVEEVQLLGTYPNPARQQVTVRYALPEPPESSSGQRVTVRLYDVLGRRVRTVVSGTRAGRHQRTLEVDGLSSGVYFLRLRAGGTVKTRRLTVVQ